MVNVQAVEMFNEFMQLWDVVFGNNDTTKSQGDENARCVAFHSNNVNPYNQRA